MVQPSGISRTLSILPGGTVPPNPTELLARQALVEAIDILKKHFDYIVLDTAPIGMVTDTQIIARVADLSVYVCRADYTHKADYTLLEDLRLEQAPQPVYRNQRLGHEKAEIRLLLWIRKVRPLLRIRKEVRLWLRLRTKA